MALSNCLRHHDSRCLSLVSLRPNESHINTLDVYPKLMRYSPCSYFLSLRTELINNVCIQKADVGILMEPSVHDNNAKFVWPASRPLYCMKFKNEFIRLIILWLPVPFKKIRHEPTRSLFALWMTTPCSGRLS